MTNTLNTMFIENAILYNGKFLNRNYLENTREERLTEHRVLVKMTLLVSLELFIESANDIHKEKTKTDDQFSFFLQKKKIFF